MNKFYYLLSSLILVVQLTNNLYAADRNTLEISLTQTISLALNNNYRQQIAKFEPELAKHNLTAAESIFEPVLFASYGYSDNSNSLTSIHESSSQKMGSVGIKGLLPWGTRYQIALEADNQQQSTLGNSSQLSSQIEFIQPLLKGAGYDAVYANINKSQHLYEISQQEYELFKQNLIQQAANAYLNLYVAEQNLTIAKHSQQLAQQTLHQEQQRFELGKISSADIYRPQASFAQRSDAVLIAEQAVQFRQNHFKSLVMPNHPKLRTLNIKVKSLQGLVTQSTTSSNKTNNKAELYQLVQQALTARPEMTIAKLMIDTNKIAVSQQDNQTKPQVDLVLRLSNSGHSTDNSLANAMDNYGSTGVKQNYIGVQYQQAIFDKFNTTKLEQQKIKLRQTQIELKQIEQQILLDIDFALFNLRNNNQRLVSAEKSVKLATKTLEAEEEKMNVGRSNSFYILDLQTRLAFAQNQLVSAKADLVKTYVEYLRQLGDISSLI